MRSDQQLDLLRHDPQRLAQAWRAAADAARQQFPNDTKRHDYYTQQAERLERQEQAA